MADIYFSFTDFPIFARAMKEAAPRYLMQAVGKGLFRMGRSDIEKFKNEQLKGSRLVIRKKGFLNSFKFFATDSREAKNISDFKLSEYTGAVPFRIFQTGGDVEARRSRMMTILAPGAKTASGKRKYSQKELREMINNGEAAIIQTTNGAAIIKVEKHLTKTGKLKSGARTTILAWLRPQIHQEKRIDFFQNFDDNSAAHDEIFNMVMQEAIDKSLS